MGRRGGDTDIGDRCRDGVWCREMVEWVNVGPECGRPRSDNTAQWFIDRKINPYNFWL